MEIVESVRYVNTGSIFQELSMAYKTIWNRLNKAYYKEKLEDVWVPHELTQKTLMDRISICKSLLNRDIIDLFLNGMVTGDKKWATTSCDNGHGRIAVSRDKRCRSLD